MQLVNLKVFKDDSIIREIIFKDGINIITNEEDDGNQIGKSTALRVINFCLGSDGKSIWIDPDTRTSSEPIRDIVTSGRVVFLLELCIKGITYKIKRKIITVHQKKRSIQKLYSWINEADFDTNDKFKAALAPILGLSIASPTYSAIKNRLVRLDKKTSSNTYRYLNSSTSDKKYVLYYSYLFGFAGLEGVAKEIELVIEQNNRNTRILFLLNNKKEQQYKDKLQSIDDEIDILKQKEELFDFKDSQNKGILKLKGQRKKIAQLTSEITRLDIRKNYAQRTIDSYETKRTSIDVDIIESIYEEARTLLPSLSKTLEETITFHEQVISKKTDYLRNQLLKYQLAQDNMQKELDTKLVEEQGLVKVISDETHLAGFIVIETEIQDKREERGRISVIIDEVAYESNEVIKLEQKIRLLREKNKSMMAQLHIDIDTFNCYFKKFTLALFKDYSLSFNVGTKSINSELEFSIVNQDKVSGDGAPRAASLAFDMAFVEFIKKTNGNLPEFTIQDYLEASDPDKLATLAKLANKNKIQVIMSVLSDKLISLDQTFINESTVLWLKQSDKFFKID